MYTIDKLDKTDNQTIYHTFLEAFSDYQINFHFSFEAFDIMLKRKGYVPGCSIGAFKEPEHQLVGFILNGIRNWHGKLTAYDLGTGVTPANRKRGLSPLMFQHALEVVAQNRVEQYLLEVLKDNKVAFDLYQKQGLSISRHYWAFAANPAIRIQQKRNYNVECVSPLARKDWEHLSQFWDFLPSWQNSVDSVLAAPQEFVYAIVSLDGQIAGYGIIEKKTGDIPQLAVRRDDRRKGIATSIAAALLNCVESDTSRVINVDDRCESMKGFLKEIGFKEFGSQYEMMLTGLQQDFGDKC